MNQLDKQYNLTVNLPFPIAVRRSIRSLKEKT